MESEAYWNDREAERGKPFWIEDLDDPKIVNYLRSETNLERSVLDGAAFQPFKAPWARGRILEVGAGVAWGSALLARSEAVREVVATDWSRHRIEEIAPLVLQQLEAPAGKVRLDVSDANSGLPKGPFDAVVFVQALYMIPDPVGLFQTILSDYLAPGGVIAVLAENIERNGRPSREKLRAWLDPERLTLPPQDVSGRRALRRMHYRRIYSKAGLQLVEQKTGYPVYPGSRAVGINYFGKRKDE